METYLLHTTDERDPMQVTAQHDHAAVEAAFAFWQYTLADKIEVRRKADGLPVATLSVEFAEEV